MKSTFLLVVFLLTDLFLAHATVLNTENAVPSNEWKAGNYYFLKSGDSFLSLDENVNDSVIVKTFGEKPTKASLDLALWEITEFQNPAGALFQFKNKRTNAILSFKAAADADLHLASGIDKWTISNEGKIQAYYDGNKLMALTVTNSQLTLSATGSNFSVYAPVKNYVLSAAQLGDGFQVFQLNFDGVYEGNIFADKNLLAKDVATTEYVTLQIKDSESFPDNKAKYIGIDTTKTEIAGAKDVFGAKFALDSTRTVIRPNADFQKFKFTVDLKNDSLSIYIKAAPSVNDATMPAADDVKIAYARINTTKVLTVAKYDANGLPTQGSAPLIQAKKGTPGKISTGTGVYFLKSTSKTATAGKYIVSYTDGNIMTTDKTPSIYQPEGQWYIKEEDGMYSIVDRNTNTSILRKGEIFSVNGSTNTFTFGNKADSIMVEFKNSVSLKDKFLGSRLFTKEEIANKGYALELLFRTEGNDSSLIAKYYVGRTADSLLQTSPFASDILAFKMVTKTDSVKNTLATGALSLGDTLYHTTYTMKEQFSKKFIGYDEAKKMLKLSETTTPAVFVFATAPEGGKYILKTGDSAVGVDTKTGYLTLTDNSSYFVPIEVESPDYATMDGGHKRFTSDGKSLTMNTLNFLAEMKAEGQPIVKANYETENFSLWLEKAPSTAAKQLYYISTRIHDTEAGTTSEAGRSYLASLRDSSKFDSQSNALVGFISRDTIKTMANSPALFAFKTTENGGYLLESQKELGQNTGKQYLGIVNNTLVMSAKGIEFTVANAASPVSNIQIESSAIRVIGETGSVSVINASGKVISVVNVLGQIKNSLRANSDHFTLTAPRGLVIVTIEGESAQKTLVK